MPPSSTSVLPKDFRKLPKGSPGYVYLHGHVRRRYGKKPWSRLDPIEGVSDKVLWNREAFELAEKITLARNAYLAGVDALRNVHVKSNEHLSELWLALLLCAYNPYVKAIALPARELEDLANVAADKFAVKDKFGADHRLMFMSCDFSATQKAA